MTKVPTMKILVASPSVPFLPIRSAMYPDERPPKAETKLRLPTMTWRRGRGFGLRGRGWDWRSLGGLESSGSPLPALQ